MKRLALVLCCMAVVVPAVADSAVDAGLAEVRELGLLNGQALACSQAQSAARIKAIMIKHAPKSRRYGEAFESSTNEAFLAQVKKDPADCLGETALAAKLEDVGARLQAAIPASGLQ